MGGVGSKPKFKLVLTGYFDPKICNNWESMYNQVVILSNIFYKMKDNFQQMHSCSNVDQLQ